MAKKVITDKQKAFADHYLANGGNATKAAKSAKYSPKTAYSQGQRLLKNAEVKKYIKSRRKKTSEKLTNTYEERVSTAQEILDRCMEVAEARDKKGEALGHYVFDSRNAILANEQLIKLGGHYAPERHDHRHQFKNLSDEELEREIERLGGGA